MPSETKDEVRYQIAGWIIFIVCAVFFFLSGLKNQDALTLIGSILFLIACIVFLIPLVKKTGGRRRR